MSIAKFTFLLFLIIFLMLAPLVRAEQSPSSSLQAEAPLQVEPPPEAIVPEKEHDFGIIQPGEAVTYTFVVENKGQGDLIIENVSPG